MRAYAEGRPPQPVQQDEARATTAPVPEEGTWRSAGRGRPPRLERRVRAAAPWPGAWTEIGDVVVVIVRARATRDFPRTLEPGEAAVRDDGIAVVRAGDDAVELLEGRSEDEETLLSADDLARIVLAARR